LAGAGAALIATSILHPLDVIKLRFQVQNPSFQDKYFYSGLTQAIKTISKKEGALGFYQGFVTNNFGAVFSSALYFYFYERAKTFFRGNDQTSTPLPAFHNLLSAVYSGLITAIITNPIWVVKARMFTQLAHQQENYKGLIHGLMVIAKTEGVRGLYRGLFISMIGVSHGGVQMMVYEELKKILQEHVELNSMHLFVAGAGAKIVASFVTYPTQVVRSRLQIRPEDSKLGHNLREIIKATWRYEGILGFYRGLFINFLRVVPASAITLTAYENIKKLLS